MKKNITVFALALMLLSAINFPMFLYAQNIDLTFIGNRISANLKQAGLGDILKKLETEKGIAWEARPETLEEKISVQFTELTLQEGVKRILAEVNHGLIYNADGSLAGIKITGSKNGNSGDSNRQMAPTVPTVSPSKAPPLQKAEHLPVEDPNGPVSPADALAQTSDAPFLPNDGEAPAGPPGSMDEPSPEVLEKFKVQKNMPPPGGNAKPSPEVLEKFTIKKNVSPP